MVNKPNQKFLWVILVVLVLVGGGLFWQNGQTFMGYSRRGSTTFQEYKAKPDLTINFVEGKRMVAIHNVGKADAGAFRVKVTYSVVASAGADAKDTSKEFSFSGLKVGASGYDTLISLDGDLVNLLSVPKIVATIDSENAVSESNETNNSAETAEYKK